MMVLRGEMSGQYASPARPAPAKALEVFVTNKSKYYLK
jgi:hypothetical protein